MNTQDPSVKTEAEAKFNTLLEIQKVFLDIQGDLSRVARLSRTVDNVFLPNILVNLHKLVSQALEGVDGSMEDVLEFEIK